MCANGEADGCGGLFAGFRGELLGGGLRCGCGGFGLPAGGPFCFGGGEKNVEDGREDGEGEKLSHLWAFVRCSSVAARWAMVRSLAAQLGHGSWAAL